METLQSPDGTTIAWHATGSGPALVVVVGAFCDSTSTAGLTALLAPFFTVYEYDRRGRGGSGDTPPYSVDREVDDLAALIAIAGAEQAPFVWGHSSGGILALRAAAASVPMQQLAVYEPPFVPGSDQLLHAVQDALDRDDWDAAALSFMSGSGMPASAIEGMRASPYWPRMRGFAPTLAYDLGLSDSSLAALTSITVPVAAVYGGASPDWAAQAANGIAATVANASAVTIEGQTHSVEDAAAAHFLMRRFLGTPG